MFDSLRKEYLVCIKPPAETLCVVAFEMQRL
jgi:hypothetical protein